MTSPAPALKRRLPAALAGALCVLLVLVAGLVWSQRGETLPGIRLGGQAVGGLDREQLRERLQGELDDRLAPVRVDAAGVPGLVDPTRAGLSLDVAASARAALAAGRRDPGARLPGGLAEQVRVPAVLAVDSAALTRELGRLAAQVDRPAHPGGFTVDPAALQVERRAAQDGRALDVAAAARRLREAVSRGTDGVLPLPVHPVPSGTSAGQVDTVVAAARRALAAPVVLRADGLQVEVPVALLAQTLTSAPGPDGGLVLDIDAAALSGALRPQVAALAVAAQDARLTAPRPAPVLTDKGDTAFAARPADVQLTPATTGRSVDLERAVAAVRTAVRTGAIYAALPLRAGAPTVPTSARQGVDQLVGSFTTSYPCCQPRVTNIRRIAALVDGTVVAPGATFSLNDVAGRRTLARGFVADGAILDGELVDQVGGGVSQFSTTMYNAAWFAGLELLDAQPHSRYISRYPPGREATLDYATIDLVWRNDTDAPVLVRTATTGTRVTVALYGHTGERSVRSDTGPRRPHEDGGFSVTVHRSTEQDGDVVDQDHTGWTYQEPL